MVVRPISASPWATTVSPGRSRSASGKSSNPTSAVAPKSGPSRRMTAMVVATLPVTIAVAGSRAVGQALEGGADPGRIDRPGVDHTVGGAALGAQAFAERGGPLVAGINPLVIADVGNPSMPMADEVLERLRNAAAVVGEHRVDRHAGGRPVEGDDGQAGVDLGLKVLMVLGDRLDDDAIHPATAHGHHRLALALLVVLGRHGHDRQPGGAGGFVGCPQDRVGVRNVADGRAHGAVIPLRSCRARSSGW